MLKRASILIATAAFTVATPAWSFDLSYVGECVPFARAASGINIYGNAWTWWGQAEGRYQRGSKPRVGAVIVFAKSRQLALGHVAVISRIVTPRVVMVTHANWSRVDGARGHTEQDVTLTDVSQDHDWSRVKVWYRDRDGLGSTVYPVYGFVYGTPAKGASETLPRAHPAAFLTGRHPDDVGALIDVYVR
uniref:CHAP domain-containing protein n=1 Tax=Sphingomonas bacterium TaxID=1895847 RepID=UPI002639C7DD|nr:CHAP domain-containing protein [Sphingomonas bacterium]